MGVRCAASSAISRKRCTRLSCSENGYIFADTLVDRIVSEELEPIGAIAEPYAPMGDSPIELRRIV
jgi:hypothetical protein